MFRITEDPTSGSFVQCLAKLQEWFYRVRWHGRVRCYNTDYIHVNGHNRTIFVILAKHCTKLPDVGYSVIRNMLEYF